MAKESTGKLATQSDCAFTGALLLLLPLLWLGATHLCIATTLKKFYQKLLHEYVNMMTMTTANTWYLSFNVNAGICVVPCVYFAIVSRIRRMLSFHTEFAQTWRCSWEPFTFDRRDSFNDIGSQKKCRTLGCFCVHEHGKLWLLFSIAFFRPIF